MEDVPEITMTLKDRAVFEGLLQSSMDLFPGAAQAIKQKLRITKLVFPGDLPMNVITLGSRVRFRVGTGPAEERTLVASSSEIGDASTIMLASP